MGAEPRSRSIIGSTRVDESGNIGIAGHRDGFFRVLKDIAVGDLMTLSSSSATKTYAVDQIEIVTPNDVSVLAPRAGPSVTLVTCYPFYYWGDAPQRFIVHAIEKQERQSETGQRANQNATDTRIKGETTMDRDAIRRYLSLGLEPLRVSAASSRWPCSTDDVRRTGRQSSRSTATRSWSGWTREWSGTTRLPRARRRTLMASRSRSRS